jgi:hypothetical protein
MRGGRSTNATRPCLQDEGRGGAVPVRAWSPTAKAIGERDGACPESWSPRGDEIQVSPSGRAVGWLSAGQNGSRSHAPQPSRRLPASCRWPHRLTRRLRQLGYGRPSVVLAWADQVRVDLTTVNVNGSAIAICHPLGCSGVRVLATPAHELAAAADASASRPSARAAARPTRSDRARHPSDRSHHANGPYWSPRSTAGADASVPVTRHLHDTDEIERAGLDVLKDRPAAPLWPGQGVRRAVAAPQGTSCL